MEEKYLVIFEGNKIRRTWHMERWFFAMSDIIAALTQSPSPKTYWRVLKNRLKDEGSQVVTKCNDLKMMASDGKNYLTDSADTETIFCVIQSIPSQKVESIKLWLAKVGCERLQELTDPEKALNRSREYWQKHGRSEKWIQQRMMGQETRNKLTDYWSGHIISVPQ